MSNRYHNPNRIHVGRMYVGTVVANTGGPYKKFIRVRIDGIDDPSIPDDKLPWSGYGSPVFRGGKAGVGFNSIPQIGTKVAGAFDAGSRDSYIAYFELNDPNNDNEGDVGAWILLDEQESGIKVQVGTTLTVQHKGATITMNEDGSILVKSPAGIQYEATQHTFVGPVSMDKTLSVTEDATIGGISFLKHVHTETGSKTKPPE